jgi:hypothetical protein
MKYKTTSHFKKNFQNQAGKSRKQENIGTDMVD